MRLLYIHDRFGNLAGAEANALITASELKQRGHEIGLLHGPGTGKGEAQWKETFGRCYPLAAKGNKSVVTAALRDFSPEVIYVHKMADLETIETLLESGTPLVRMVHDHDLYCMRSYKYNVLTRKICTRPATAYCIFPCGAVVTRNRNGFWPIRFNSYAAKQREIALNRRFRRMVVVTTYMRDELLRNGFDPARIEIHAPIPRMGDPNIRSDFSERNLILYAGQLIRGKGVDVLLESLARVTARFECVILGDGSQKARCQKLCKKLGLQDRVTFKGFVPQEELKNYYRECSVVAISSVWPEPIATIGLEVMRYGLPVVAFDAGGIKDWLKDGVNGFLVPWMDRDAYARRLEYLLTHKDEARRMGEKGLEFASRHYDFSQYIVDLETMFQRVICEAIDRASCPSPPQSR